MANRKKTDRRQTPTRGAGQIPPRDPPAAYPSAPLGPVVAELVGHREIAFSTVDIITGRPVEMRLRGGLNTIPGSVFAAFRDDPFFRDHVVGKILIVKSGDDAPAPEPPPDDPDDDPDDEVVDI